MLSEAHEALRYTTVDELREAPDEVRGFVEAFLRTAVDWQVPVYCRAVWGNDVEIVHAQFLDRLAPGDWSLLGRLGHIAAGRRFSVEWGGPRSPALWTVACDDAAQGESPRRSS